jgi:hypothetical protein
LPQTWLPNSGEALNGHVRPEYRPARSWKSRSGTRQRQRDFRRLEFDLSQGVWNKVMAFYLVLDRRCAWFNQENADEFASIT